MAQPPAPPPTSVLGRHRLLSPTASVYVSPLCLGAMNFGEAWKGILAECSKETAFSMLDHFYELGGNFIDTQVPQENQADHVLTANDIVPICTKTKSRRFGSASGFLKEE